MERRGGEDEILIGQMTLPWDSGGNPARAVARDGNYSTHMLHKYLLYSSCLPA